LRVAVPGEDREREREREREMGTCVLRKYRNWRLKSCMVQGWEGKERKKLQAKCEGNEE
jgi:hypothetical protein